jgi:hypothetical protein
MEHCERRRGARTHSVVSCEMLAELRRKEQRGGGHDVTEEKGSYGAWHVSCYRQAMPAYSMIPRVSGTRNRRLEARGDDAALFLFDLRQSHFITPLRLAGSSEVY